jgi:hypothetical protein
MPDREMGPRPAAECSGRDLIEERHGRGIDLTEFCCEWRIPPSSLRWWQWRLGIPKDYAPPAQRTILKSTASPVTKALRHWRIPGRRMRLLPRQPARPVEDGLARAAGARVDIEGFIVRQVIESLRRTFVDIDRKSELALSGDRVGSRGCGATCVGWVRAGDRGETASRAGGSGESDGQRQEPFHLLSLK